VRCTNIFGLSEVIGPGVSCECVEERAGSHVNEDHFLPEIVDPETGEPLPEGESGVLVFTTLTKQALPLVRYWTGDITSLRSEPCACGRTLVRMGLITGRSDDMLIIRGVNVYPTQVEAALLELTELTPNYRIVVSRSGTLDEAEVEVEVSETFLRERQRQPVRTPRARPRAPCPDRTDPPRDRRLHPTRDPQTARQPAAVRRRQAPTRARPPQTHLNGAPSARRPHQSRGFVNANPVDRLTPWDGQSDAVCSTACC